MTTTINERLAALKVLLNDAGIDDAHGEDAEVLVPLSQGKHGPYLHIACYGRGERARFAIDRIDLSGTRRLAEIPAPQNAVLFVVAYRKVRS